MQIVGVKFRPVGEIEFFREENLDLKLNDKVICETENGLMFGVVCRVNVENAETQSNKVLRLATKDDEKKLEHIAKRSQETLKTAKDLVKKHGIDMKIVDADWTFDQNKLTLSFTSEGRVDFRDLLKSLASEFRARIELKQIGARDETKILGGYGPCGRPLCCANHLRDFGKVGIKMAKDQGLSLNPTSINGICNRLLCCLGYEEDDYTKALAKMPKLNSKVKTPEGEGVVIFNNVLKDEVSVKFVNEDGSYSIKDFALVEIEFEKKADETNE